MSGQGIADDHRITGERGILNDNQIAHLALWQGMIDPFVSHKVREPNRLSWGLEPFGYTLRLNPLLTVPVQSRDRAADPKAAQDAYHMNVDEGFTILPGQLFWATTMERIKLPRNITMLIQGKSTYARAGLIVNTTPFDAGWEGYPTLTLLNPTTEAIMLYAEEGFAQALFFRGERPAHCAKMCIHVQDRRKSRCAKMCILGHKWRFFRSGSRAGRAPARTGASGPRVSHPRSSPVRQQYSIPAATPHAHSRPGSPDHARSWPRPAPAG